MFRRLNRLKAAQAEGRLAYGLCVQMLCPETVEVAGAVGYDFVYIDCEHGAFGLEGAVQLIRAAEASSVTPFVRVPDHEPSFIMRVLDAGAMGVIVPQVSTPAEAEAAVSAARYRNGDNGGRRGACPGTRATWHQATDWSEFALWSNDNVSVIALIETDAGLSNFAEIAAVPGLDASMFGPFDYAHEAGLPGQPQHEAVQRRYAEALKVASRLGHPVVASLFSQEPSAIGSEAREFARQGVCAVVAGSDRRVICNGLKARLEAMR